MADDNLLTVHQAAIILKVHHLTVRRYIREGKLKAIKAAGIVRIPRSAIEGFGQELHPTLYGVRKVTRGSKVAPFSLEDPIFRLKGRGLSLYKQGF